MIPKSANRDGDETGLILISTVLSIADAMFRLEIRAKLAKFILAHQLQILCPTLTKIEGSESMNRDDCK